MPYSITNKLDVELRIGQAVLSVGGSYIVDTLSPELVAATTLGHVAATSILEGTYTVKNNGISETYVGGVRLRPGQTTIFDRLPDNADNAFLNGTLTYTFTPAPSGPTTDEEMPYSKRVDFITDNELFKGEAAVGSPESSPLWRIRKLLIGSDGDITEIYANGTADFTNSWVSRSSYTYS